MQLIDILCNYIEDKKGNSHFKACFRAICTQKLLETVNLDDFGGIWLF